jgi:hypothetical protein
VSGCCCTLPSLPTLYLAAEGPHYAQHAHDPSKRVEQDHHQLFMEANQLDFATLSFIVALFNSARYCIIITIIIAL